MTVTLKCDNYRISSIVLQNLQKTVSIHFLKAGRYWGGESKKQGFLTRNNEFDYIPFSFVESAKTGVRR